MATTLISADFDVDEEGFVFRDDAFRGTSQPVYSDGTRIPAGGFSGGALQVLLGGVDNADILGMSGGWDRDFTLATPQQVTVSFRVKLTQASDYENDEFSEALVALDGTLLITSGTDSIARITGNGNGGGPRTTDWIEVEINLGVLAAGTHTLTFGGFNNKKTLANEETEILFDDIEVVADDPPPGPGEGVLIDANFDVDTNGFIFLDDTFRGTNEPAFADGQRTATGGFSGGGLEVTLGGIDDTDVNGMSGGWQTSFNLASEAVVTISFRYNLTQASNYESNEFSQVLLSLDGVLVGTQGNDFIAQINGNGGPERSTGWQVVEINLGLLGPGNHDLIIGGFNNRKTLADEETNLRIDDVFVTELPPPPPGDLVILQDDFDTDTGGFGFIDDAFRGTGAPAFADGQRTPDGGFGGSGALRVELGGIDNSDVNGMSGGWRRTFNLAAETDVVLSFRYKLTQAPNYENDEFSQVLVDLDGLLVTPNGNDFIDQITGNGNGGPERSTGFQVVEIDLGTLSAGTHTLTIGGFNNKKTFADETTEIIIDDLLLIAGGSAPILDLDADNSSGATGNDYTDTFTEQGDGPPPVAAGVAVPIGDVDVDIDDPDGTQIQSATITLTNPQTGDQLSLFGGAGSLPAGISLDGASTATNIILTGLASLASYETAIELVRFATGADDNPDTTQRIVNVQVVDEIGLPSNTAVATIDVVATNNFPTPQDDNFGTTDEDTILAAGVGGLLLGSLFDDNSSGADDDPEGDDIDVAGLSNIVPPVLPAGAVASGVNDGGTNFNFTLTAGAAVATVFVDKATGNVNVEATTGDFFGLLGTGETATVSFDYTIADPQGSNGTTATATFDVNGAFDLPALFTENADNVNFNTVLAGDYQDGTENDALGGDDIVTLPDLANEAASGFTIGSTFVAGAGEDTVNGGDGNDVIDGDDDDDLLYGAGGDDLLYGTDDDNVLYGDTGVNPLTTLVGGNDTLVGGDNLDTLYGEAGNDILYGDEPGSSDAGAQGETLYGGTGDDTLFGGHDGDRLYGDAGGDLLYGDFGDLASNPNDDDLIYGGDGNDSLFGENGADVLFGGADNDILFGGLGDDTLTGDGGIDTFVLIAGDGTDTIVDYLDGTDRLGLGGGLTFGALTISQVLGDVEISVTAGGEVLAILTTETAGNITSGDFDIIP